MNKIIWLMVVVSGVSVNLTVAADVFPPFETNSLSLAVPVSIPGSFKDWAHMSGDNYVYALNGQMFSDLKDGHIQTTAQGFSGKTDERTPWETLTQVLACYQNGGSKEAMTALYDSTSTDFINMLQNNEPVKERFQSFCKSIAGMRAVLWFKYGNGYMAFVRLDFNDGHHEMTQFFFVRDGAEYKISAAQNKKPDPCFLNVGLLLNKQLSSGTL